MLRFLKYSGIAFVIVLGVLLIAPLLIDVDHYRTQIERQVEDATGRSLHIGEMQASLFPWIGLKLKNVEFANAKGFSSPSFLKVGRLDVQLAFLPLLQQKIELKRFELEAPEIYLQRNQNGEGNWQDLQIAGKSAAKDPTNNTTSNTPLLFGFMAESIQINNGIFSWQDDVSGQNLTLKDMQLSLLDVQQERPVTIHASVTIGDDRITLQGKVGPVGDLERLDPERLPVQLQLSSKHLALAQFSTLLPALPTLLGDKNLASVAMNIQLEQRPDGVRSSNGIFTLKAAHELALQWKAEQLDSQHVQLKSSTLSLDGQTLLHSKGNITFIAESTPRITMQINSETITRTWLTALLPKLAPLYANHPKPWTQLNVGLALNLAGDTLTVQDMKLQLDQDLLIMSGRILMSGNPNIRLRLRANQLHLDPWIPASEKTTKASDSSVAEAQATEPDLREFSTWRLDIQSTIGQLHVKNTVLDDVVFNIQSEKGKVTIKPVAFGIAGGRVHATASLNTVNYPVTWRESVRMKNVKIGPLLQQFADSDQLDGSLQLTSNLQGRGLLPTSIKASLTGKGKMKMSNGKVKGFDIANALRNITSLGKKGGAQYTDFAQLQASFTARNGIINNNDLFMASPLFRLTGKGIVNLPASTMDYHMRPKLVATLVGQGDQANARTGITIPLHIVGPFDSPSISPELDASTLIGSLKNALKGNGTGVADTLQGVGKSLGDGATKVNAGKAAKEKLNNALGGLIPGF